MRARMTAQGKRIMGSRFVHTRKLDEETKTVKRKSRFCVRGDQDHQLLELIREHKTGSATVSTSGRTLALQLIASHLQL